tara:strand:+ start:103 stop:297 length:195 start_codon:yes stop_codon:yes gene_type:complete
MLGNPSSFTTDHINSSGYEFHRPENIVSSKTDIVGLELVLTSFSPPQTVKTLPIDDFFPPLVSP